MRTVVGLFFLLYSVTGLSEQLIVEYSSFYSHTKKLESEDTNTLQFAFGFIHVNHKHLCQIQSAYINTQKQNIAISISPSQRFVLPSEKALKMANASVIIELTEAANLCDMSVQLETKPEYLKTEYTAQELTLLFKQYQSFFADMGGLFSFMMPSVEGLLLHFTDTEHTEVLENGLLIESGVLALNAPWIIENKGLSLTQSPLRVTAMLVK